MYKLYYSPGACSMAVHVMLRELGVPFDLHSVKLMDGQQHKPEFLAINPRGQIPVLVENGQPIKEGAAIMMYLAAKHPTPLLRMNPPDAAALEWLCWGNSTLHPAYARAFWLRRNFADEANFQALMKNAIAIINKEWAFAEQTLATRPFLAGNDPSMADVLMTVVANWGLPEPAQIGPNVKRVLKAMVARPSYQAALAAEQVEYKAAA